MTETGIYGGTFAPVHNGHIRAAYSFLDEMKLDRLLIIPALIPPHKQISWNDDPYARLEMLRLAFAGEDKIEISDYEISEKRRSYTVLTLEHYASPDTRLNFLCGTDMFLTLEEWHRPERIFELCRIVYMRRDKRDYFTDCRLYAAAKLYRERYGADIAEIRSEPVAVTSSEIRDACRAGKSIDDLVPPPVGEYIRKNHLYGS